MTDLITIRTYLPEDAQDIANIYYNTIHNINIRDYTKEQVEAWAPYSSIKDYSGWQKKLAKTKPFVAVIGKKIVGFADLNQMDTLIAFMFIMSIKGVVLVAF